MNRDEFDALIAKIDSQLPPSESKDSVASYHYVLDGDDVKPLNSPMPQPITHHTEQADTP